jgi:hypothetical protein
MTKIIKKFGWLTAVLAISTLILSTAGTAQDRDEQDQQGDPPSRVARIGYLEGSVSFQPAGEPDWVQAVANRPMTTGDKLWTDKDSRAELQLGSAVIRLSSNTGFSFLNLDDNTVQIQLRVGFGQCSCAPVGPGRCRRDRYTESGIFCYPARKLSGGGK